MAGTWRWRRKKSKRRCSSVVPPGARWGWVTQPICRSISLMKFSIWEAAARAFSRCSATSAAWFSWYEK